MQPSSLSRSRLQPSNERQHTGSEAQHKTPRPAMALHVTYWQPPSCTPYDTYLRQDVRGQAQGPPTETAQRETSHKQLDAATWRHGDSHLLLSTFGPFSVPPVHDHRRSVYPPCCCVCAKRLPNSVPLVCDCPKKLLSQFSGLFALSAASTADRAAAVASTNAWVERTFIVGRYRALPRRCQRLLAKQGCLNVSGLSLCPKQTLFH